MTKASTATDIPAAQRIECRKCHRALTNAASRVAGIGPRCAAIEAATEGLKPAQVDKTLELLADNGVIRTAHRKVFRTAASKGERAYYTTARSCTCRWGQKVMKDRIANGGVTEMRDCYHVAGVKLTTTPRRSLAKAA